MIQDYERLVEKIAEVSDKDEKEITKLVEKKREKLSGLISREGAAQIVASELGINFDKEEVKIDEIMEGQKKVNTFGKVARLFPVNEYERNGKKEKVVNFILADETDNIKTVLWDSNHVKLIEDKKIEEGDFVEISNARLRDGELHLSSFSDIKKSDREIENVQEERKVREKPIKDFSIGKEFMVRAVVVQAFQPKFFNVCPNCGKKVTRSSDGYECGKHGEVTPKERALLPLILDDGTDSIRAVLFSEQIGELGLSHEQLKPEEFEDKKKEVLGEEAIFYGRVKQNKMFNNTEMLVNKVEEVKIEDLIEKLEK